MIEDFSENPLTSEEEDRLKTAMNSEVDDHKRAKIEKYLKSFQSGENIQKAYGSTLVAVAACDTYVMGIHIGDGTCVAFYEDGTCDQPIPTDSRNIQKAVESLPPVPEVVEPTPVQEKEAEVSDVDVKDKSIEPSEQEPVSDKTGSGDTLVDADIISMLDNNSRKNES